MPFSRIPPKIPPTWRDARKFQLCVYGAHVILVSIALHTGLPKSTGYFATLNRSPKASKRSR